MAARLEELGNDLKDKGLDPEKNRKFQKESIKLQRAELRERLKNAETPSERIEILKEQSSKDRKALTLQQKTLLGILKTRQKNDAYRRIKDGGYGEKSLIRFKNYIKNFLQRYIYHQRSPQSFPNCFLI